MATAVISGRVDELVKQRAEAVLAKNGVTPNQLIGAIWNQIAQTGTIPISMGEDELQAHRRQRFAEFQAWTKTLPPCPSLANATDEELREMIVEGLVEKYG